MQFQCHRHKVVVAFCPRLLQNLCLPICTQLCYVPQNMQSICFIIYHHCLVDSSMRYILRGCYKHSSVYCPIQIWPSCCFYVTSADSHIESYGKGRANVCMKFPVTITTEHWYHTQAKFYSTSLTCCKNQHSKLVNQMSIMWWYDYYESWIHVSGQLVVTGNVHLTSTEIKLNQRNTVW